MGTGGGGREKKVSGRRSRHVLLKTSLSSSRLKWEQSELRGGGDYKEAESTTPETNLDLLHIKAGGVTLLFNDISTTRYLISY